MGEGRHVAGCSGGPCAEQEPRRGGEASTCRSLEPSGGARAHPQTVALVPCTAEPGPPEGCSHLERSLTRTWPSHGTESCPSVSSSRTQRFMRPFDHH